MVLKVMITGAAGQLGQTLVNSKPAGVDIAAFDAVALNVGAALDICDETRVQEQVSKTDPDVIINAAAYTAVDRAEEDAELAYRVNAEGAANLAFAAQGINSRMLQISTDFVFGGEQSRPYCAEDLPAPVSVYGASKLAGEEQVLAVRTPAAVVRTAWVYSAYGNNFMKTMLRLMAERDSLGVVADQVGTPTATSGLAAFLWELALMDADRFEACPRILHWTDAGVASWYDFAVAIYEEGRAQGVLNSHCAIQPVTTADYPTQAKRPPYSVLDKSQAWQISATPVRHWRENLRTTLQSYILSGES